MVWGGIIGDWNRVNRTIPTLVMESPRGCYMGGYKRVRVEVESLRVGGSPTVK